MNDDSDPLDQLRLYQEVKFLCIHKMRRAVRWENRQVSMEEIVSFVKEAMLKYKGRDVESEFIKKEIRVGFATGDLKYPCLNIWGPNPVPPGFEELGE